MDRLSKQIAKQKSVRAVIEGRSKPTPVAAPDANAYVARLNREVADARAAEASAASENNRLQRCLRVVRAGVQRGIAANKLVDSIDRALAGERL